MTTKTTKSAPARSNVKRGRAKAERGSKLDILVKLLRATKGASVDELAGATGWQKHSVRGALAGTLKKKGHSIASEVVDGTRRYRIAETQS